MSSELPTRTQWCALVALTLALAAAPAGAAPALGRWGSLPVSFEPNRGQTLPSVDFVARSRDGVGLLAGGALTLRFDRCARAVRMSLAGARARKPEGLEPLPGITSYFLGSDPSRWIAGIPTYGQVLYREVLPGVDLRYHGSEGHLELDMVLAPDANPGRLRLAFDGADRVSVDPNGDLQLAVAGQTLTLRRPVAYQEVAGERRAVAAEYVVKGPRGVAIALGERDRSRPVVVDPVLVYSAQLGSSSSDGLEAVAVDSSGAAYATGYGALGFPTAGTPIQGYGGATNDVVVLKLDPSGSSLVYSVFLGGAFPDTAYGIAVDSAGNAIVAGETGSADYPVTSGAIQGTYAGGSSEAFVSKINAAGNGLVYSTYAGGGQVDFAIAVAADSSGNAYITGGTQSSNWVVTANAFQVAKAGNKDAFLLKLDPSGNRLYSTFLGGQQEDYGQGIAVNGTGDIFVTGVTSSADFPTANAYQGSLGGGSDVFVLKLSSAGDRLLFSTYLGGGSDDISWSLALHPTTGGPVIAGQTLSTNFPATPGAYDTIANGGLDGFVTELTSSGGLVFSTYLGGSSDDAALGVAQSPTGGLWVTGHTVSSDFPTTGGPYQGTEPGGLDAFLAQLRSDGSALDYSTYLGGAGDDRALNLAIDGLGGVYLVGEAGASFPSTPGSFRSTGAPSDGFLAKFHETLTLSLVNPATGPTAGGTQVTLSGAGFTPNLSATFGGAPVPATFSDATTLVARVPPHAAGAVDVQVVATDGTKSNLLSNGFTYVADGGGGGGGDGGEVDGGAPDSGVPGRPLDALGCSCASSVSSSTAFALAMLAAIAVRSRQRRRPTSAPPSQ